MSPSALNGIKALFFDAGGTLIHLDAPRICDLLSAELRITASLEGFQHAQSIAMQRVAALVAEGAGSTENLKREFYSMLLPRMGVRSDLDTAIDCVLKLAQSEMLWRRTETDTARALERLKERGLRLAVISNSDGRIESAFHQAGLFDYFDFFIDSFLVGVEKPDPRIFHIALDRADVEACEAVYVGDLYSVDVAGAKAAGLAPVLYDPFGLNSETDCLKIRAIGDLIDLLGVD
jgi:putative hydrolase of the HAD superfamily